jgi:hypothetical protein
VTRNGDVILGHSPRSKALLEGRPDLTPIQLPDAMDGGDSSLFANRR